MRICSIIAARNEENYLSIVIPAMIREGIDLIILNNESDDRTADIAEQYRGKGVIDILSIPYRGHFSLLEQLQAKERIIAQLDHDWVIHQDADEIMQSRNANESLRDAIQLADKGNYNVVAFNEFVFTPIERDDYAGRDFLTDMRHYYFYEPGALAFMRAWRRDAGFSNIIRGGHALDGEDIRIAQTKHVLRHYIALNFDQVVEKLCRRQFSPFERKIGWHSNRITIDPNKLRLPLRREMFELSSGNSKGFRRDYPRRRHFWEWPEINAVNQEALR